MIDVTFHFGKIRQKSPMNLHDQRKRLPNDHWCHCSRYTKEIHGYFEL